MPIKNKKIMLDVRVITKNSEHGIARYARELVNFLITDGQTKNLDFILLVRSNADDFKLLFQNKIPKNFLIVSLKTTWLSLLGQLELCYMIFKYKPDLFHAPAFVVPLLSSVPLIATIHDLNHLALKQNYSFKQKIYYFFLKYRLLKSQAVITVSFFSKQEIIKYFQIEDKKIHVIYNGISPVFKKKSEFDNEKINYVRKKYSLPEKYIFAIGNHKPHKNLNRLVEAYSTGSFSIPLVVLSDQHTETLKIADKYHKKESIYFFTSLIEEDFSLFYALSTVFIYPSLYEGFGFPPLEAAASGIPVVASQTTSLPEILKDTVIYVDPEKVEDIQRGLCDALSGDEKKLQNNIANAFALSKKYTWQRMGEETLDLYTRSVTE